MVAADLQGQGYGGQALRLAVASAQGWGAGHLVVGVNDTPHGNKGFCLRHGFRDNGMVEEGDLPLTLNLAPDVQSALTGA